MTATKPKAKKTAAKSPDPTFSGNKYHRLARGLKAYGHHKTAIRVDVYSFLRAYAVTCPACQHAAKKT
ncbi:MAG: hypothetical protein K2V38_13295 [Gemmataceae bacterium]|nr:hypothetical protein [Gemmataceae bacterium]